MEGIGDGPLIIIGFALLMLGGEFVVQGAVTIAGTPAVGDICYFRIFRDVSDANDDMAEDARLIGVKLFFTTDAANDA